MVNKVWSYAHVLCDDGVGYGDYVEAAPGVLPPAALVHGPGQLIDLTISPSPCTLQLPINEVPHECV